MIMKKSIALLFLLPLCVTSAKAFYPSFLNHDGEPAYTKAVMDVAHDDDYIYVAKLDGLVVIDKKTGEKVRLSARQGTLDYTPSSITLHNGDVWIGTLEKAVLRYTGGQITAYDYGVDAFVSNIAFDSRGNMYISCGSYQGVRVDAVTKEAEKFEVRNRYSYCFNGHICVGLDDAVWFGNFGLTGTPYFGLTRYVHGGGTTYLMREHKDLPGHSVGAMDIDGEGCIWYQSYGNGSDGCRLTRIVGDEASVSYECPSICFDMKFDAGQRLWLAGKNGPLLMMKDGEFTDYACPIETKRWLCMDLDGDAVYIGTDETLLKYEDGAYTTIDVEVTNLPEMMVEVEMDELTGMTSIRQDDEKYVGPAFDLLGRHLFGTPQRGLYIREGKKVLK